MLAQDSFGPPAELVSIIAGCFTVAFLLAGWGSRRLTHKMREIQTEIKPNGGESGTAGDRLVQIQNTLDVQNTTLGTIASNAATDRQRLTDHLQDAEGYKRMLLDTRREFYEFRGEQRGKGER